MNHRDSNRDLVQSQRGWYLIKGVEAKSQMFSVYCSRPDTSHIFTAPAFVGLLLSEYCPLLECQHTLVFMLQVEMIALVSQAQLRNLTTASVFLSHFV